MMDDAAMEFLYKSAISISHYAGLRAVYDAGYYAGAAQVPTTTSLDQSVVQSLPVAEVTIQMV